MPFDSMLGAHEVRRVGSCSDIHEIHLESGEQLIMKRPHHDWAMPRLRASRRAAGLLRRRTGVIAPRHLEVEQDVNGSPVEAYWRIPLTTLAEIWWNLSETRWPQAARSWGALLRRIHKVKLAGYGSLDAGNGSSNDLASFLHADVHDRLMPALYYSWPAAVASAHQLLAVVPKLEQRCSSAPPVLVHNDFHMGNVLCELRPRTVRCLGAIDLESAWAGPAEADFAKLQILHHPIFGDWMFKDWMVHFLHGYGATFDPALLAFFRGYHLLNLGYFAAFNGYFEHAGQLHRLMCAELVAPDICALAD